MAIELRYNTAGQEVPLGYFLDSTDGDTEETALTIANTDIKVWKWGATTLASKNSGGATHISNGIYYAVLDATDTNTLGPAKIFTHVAGGLSFEIEINVVSQQYWDAKYGSGNFNSDVIAISGDSTAADNAESFFDGTGYAGTGNTIPTVTTLTNKTGFALSSTGADLILKSSTFVQAIVAAVNEFATYGLTALNTLLTSTGIKTATTAAPADMALDSTVAKDATVSKPGTAQTITAPADMALNSTVAKEAKQDIIDTNVDAILVDTGTTIPAQISALNNISSAEVNAACDTALTDYGANTVVPDAAGTAPTAAEIKTALEAAGGTLALTKTEVDATKAIADKLDDMIEVVP